MIGKTKTTVLALTVMSMLAAPLADAARLGKGRSSGMQRAAPTQNYRPSPLPQQQAIPAQAQPAPRQGVGVGTAIAAGAAGAAAGYLLGQAGHNNNSSATQQAANQGSSFPWGMVLLGLGVLGAFMFFRRRNAQAAQRAPAQAPLHYQGNQGAATFPPIPPIGSGSGAPAYAPSTANLSRLPDGTETPHFLRQAKATFLHLQSLNTTESLEEVRKYLTPEMFEAVRGDIAGNTEVADFPQLECNLLEAAQEGNRFIASVRFSGTVSESVNAAAVPFAETWHYVKDPAVNDRWLLAGIQQS